MTRTEEFIHDLMADHDPAPGRDVPGSARRYAEQRLRDAMAETTTLDRPFTTEPSRSWWRRRLNVATAAVGVLAVVAALVINPDVLPGGGETGAAYAATPPLLMSVDQPGASAEQTLLVLAAAADQQPDLGDGTYRHLRTASWYLHTSVSDGQGTSVIVPEITDRWLAIDGSGVVAAVEGQPVEAGPPGQPADEQARRQLPAGNPQATRHPAGSLHAFNTDDLPTDPNALHDTLMEADNGSLPEHVYLYRSLTDRLVQQRLQPDLLAAYYRMLSVQPEMRVFGTVADRVGREGVAIGFDTNVGGLPSRYMLIIDQDTGTPLGVEEVLTTDAGKLGVEVPAVIGYEVVLAGGRVNSTDVSGPDIP